MLYPTGHSGARRRFRPSVLAAGLLILIPADASAHARLAPGEAEANATLRAVLTIPRGCDGAPTHQLRVGLPEGFVAPTELAQAGHGHHGEAALPSGHAELGPISVTDGFARASVTSSGAAYLVIRNGGETADRLLSAASPAAARVELHATSEADGVMRMQSLPEGIAVPAHGSVTLEPGGMHVMLMGLDAPLVEGEALPLTLSFEHAGEVALSVPIRSPGAGAGAGAGEDAESHSHGNH